ncbi:hypothetical protein NLJ89_g1290 [Agrocybe chaxingu]|uniref:MULE transposase domain-containing protein n=1 Tax=Agrocybe chaxingu TaxID=84603 RepID=A0A9W8N088_9AGAR|nr:hypothetical protein NLJ89_g1290 [Agrocybe chaxingu]
MPQIPATASATVISPGEVVPSYGDLLPITAEMEDAYKKGMNSALITFQHDGEEYEFMYHFSKINLIREISNHQPAVQAYRHLLTHLQSRQFSLGPALEAFQNSSCTSRIQGFNIADFEMSKLECLLGENWLEEDVFNALLELAYFRQATKAIPASPIADPTPSNLILPTSFLADAVRAYDSSFRHYTREIVFVRQRIMKTAVKIVSMSQVYEDHFTAFVYKAGSSVIKYGDSMHQLPPQDMLPVLQWIFDGICNPGITRIEAGKIARQGFGGGEGSCGIAASNFMELAVHSRPGLCPWRGSNAKQFRDAALEDLILFHYAATQTSGSFETWTTSILEEFDDSLSDNSSNTESNNVSGFNDFNLYTPLSNHPIMVFAKQPVTSLRQAIERTVVRPAPPLSRLPSVPLNQVAQPLLPPFEPVQTSKKLGVKSISAPLPTHGPVSKISPLRPSHKRHQRSLDDIDSVLILKARKEPLAPKLPTSQLNDALDLSLPVTPKSRKSISSTFIDLSYISNSPIQQIKKENYTLMQPVKQETSSDVINLCTPEQRPRPRNRPTLMQPAVKQETGGNVIDLRTPEQHPRNKKFKISDSPTSHSVNPNSSLHRTVIPAPDRIQIGTIFHSVEEAQKAIFAREERLGHRWKIAQSRQDASGRKRKVTFRCDHYYYHKPTRSRNIDPSDYRKSKTIKTGCMAHVNVNRVAESGDWCVTLTDFEHNHPRATPEGAPVQRPATKEQKAAIGQLATDPSNHFTRGQIAAVLSTQTGTSKLEPRQISNIMMSARREAHTEIERLGGDINAIIASLQKKAQEEHGWNWRLKVDENMVVTGIWWQSPLQADLAKRYGDVLLNDNTYNRNRSGYPLNIGIIIDGHGSSRNVWYALHAVEDRSHFSWVLQSHIETTGYAPDVFMSDRHAALISSVQETMPLTDHCFCMHHLDGNVDQNLRRTVPPTEWSQFKDGFWAAYRAVSPEEFDRHWRELTQRFPSAQKYLDNELYPCREQWAWAFMSHKFTCGVRTTGRVEGENRVNKAIGGPKKSLKELFDGLNKRTDGQSVQELIKVRDSSRRQHASSIELIFPGPLQLLREYAGPFALTTCFAQMEQSMFYRTETILRPAGIETWADYAIQVGPSVGYTWEDGEETTGNPPASDPCPTQTVPSRTVFHEANAALRPLMNGIQTQEDLDDLLDDLNELRAHRQRAANAEQLHDPPILNPKGRPRTQRITGVLEGRARGGGATSRSAQNNGGRKCGICRQQGHRRDNCPSYPSG